MRKKYGRIAVFVLGCLLAVWGMIIYPILNRGSIAFSFSNNTDYTYTVIRINEQSVNEVLEAGGSLTVKYPIPQEEQITVYLSSESGELYEKEVTGDLNKTVSPENYGRVLVTIKEKKGNIELSVVKNIS